MSLGNRSRSEDRTLPPSPFPPPSVLTGRIVARSIVSPERCESRSKLRIEATSSPHHSRRAGAAIPNPYTSRIPPRTLNCATSVTVGTRSYPMSVRRPTTSLSDTLPPSPFPGANTSLMSRSAAGTPVRSAAARAVVTSTRTCPDSSSSSVSTRSPAISTCGSSAPSASRCGYSATTPPASVRRSASHRSASVGVEVITTKTRWARRRASVARRRAGLEPRRPPTARRPPGGGRPSASARVAGSASI